MVAPSRELAALGRLMVTTVTAPRRSTSTDMKAPSPLRPSHLMHGRCSRYRCRDRQGDHSSRPQPTAGPRRPATTAEPARPRRTTCCSTLALPAKPLEVLPLEVLRTAGSLKMTKSSTCSATESRRGGAHPPRASQPTRRAAPHGRRPGFQLPAGFPSLTAALARRHRKPTRATDRLAERRAPGAVNRASRDKSRPSMATGTRPEDCPESTQRRSPAAREP